MANQSGPSIIKSIAQELGVSTGTVSIVLNGRGTEMRISKATQERVLECAKKFNYKPNVFAKRLRNSQQNSTIIALFWPMGFRMTMVSRCLKGIMEFKANNPNNIDLLLFPYTQDHLSDSMQHLSSYFCNGAVIMGLSETDYETLENNTFDIPIILLNRQSNKYIGVCIDDYDVGAQAASILISRGHRRLSMIGYQSTSQSSRKRRAGFFNTCYEESIPISKVDNIQTSASFEGGEEAAKIICGYPKDDFPTGIFIMDSSQAFSALSVFHQAGIRIPEDLEIISYGDDPMDAYIYPSLTSIRMPLEQMSQDCMKILLTQLTNNPSDTISMIHPLTVSYRTSCGPKGDPYLK